MEKEENGILGGPKDPSIPVPSQKTSRVLGAMVKCMLAMSTEMKLGAMTDDTHWRLGQDFIQSENVLLIGHSCKLKVSRPALGL